MVLKDKGVQIKVSTNFFNGVFEPSRRAVEKELGIRVSQKEFSSMIFQSGLKFKPKLLTLKKNGTRKNKIKKR